MGSRCLSIMKTIRSVEPERVRLRLLAVATIQDSPSCRKVAAGMGVVVYEDYQDLLALEELDLILEFTGNPVTLCDIISKKRPHVGVLDRQAATMLLDMLRTVVHGDCSEPEGSSATFASTLLEKSPDGVLVIDRDYRIIDYNKSPLIAEGANREAILGRFCFEVMHRIMAPCAGVETGCPALETQRAGRPVRTVHEIKGPNSLPRICQVTAYPVYDQSGEIDQFVLTIGDMTNDLCERVEQRAQAIKKDLAQAVREDRLNSLGRLVASVCHEINNPITSIVTFTKLVLSMIQRGAVSEEETANMEKYLALSFREAMRCGSIVKNLLTFARPKSLDAREIDILEVVDTILLLIGHQLESAGVKHTVTLPSPPFTAWGDFSQIQQCLLNLLFNAIDAMPDGGIITIAGGTDEEKDLIWLSVSDTGQGIEPVDLQQIFEPFYSTKTEGKGVGLGLSMVYGIIRDHNGVVDVESEPGKGTTFMIKLPRRPPQDKNSDRFLEKADPMSSGHVS